MGILVGVLAIALNRTFCALMLYVEERLVAKGRIPPQGQILYFRDYNFFKMGDRWFLSATDFAIAFVLVERSFLPVWVAILCFLAGGVWTALWHHIYLGESHRPDSAYPFIGVVSPVGRIHIVYFGAQYVLGFMGIGMLVLMAMWASARGLLPSSWVL